MAAEKSPKQVGIVFVASLLLYMGSYFALVRHDPFQMVFLTGQGPWHVSRDPDYRIGILGSGLSWVFHPAHIVDTKLRPNYWHVDGEDSLEIYERLRK